MKTFKQILAEVREVNIETEPTEASHLKQKSAHNPHSILHEIETVAHFNAVRDAQSQNKPIENHLPEERHYEEALKHHWGDKWKDKLNHLRNTVDERSKKSKGGRPDPNKVRTRAMNDATFLASQNPDHVRAHWTPHMAARRAIHPGITHSGDMVLTREDNKGTAHAIDLKYGKGTSLSPPTHQKVMAGLVAPQQDQEYERSKIKRARGMLERGNIPTHRGKLFNIIAKNIHRIFNKLPNTTKRSFVKSLWGGSSDSQRVRSFRLHDNQRLEDVDKSFDEKFKPNEPITSEVVQVRKNKLPRGLRISSGSTTINLSHKYPGKTKKGRIQGHARVRYIKPKS